MNAQAIPPIAIASITLYVGFYNLLIYLRRTTHREHLTFALTCVAMGLYDIFCAGLYNAASVPEGVPWQQLQYIALAGVAIAFSWFVSDYLTPTEDVPRWWKRGLVVFSVYFVLAAVSGFLNPVHLYWPVGEFAIKHIVLPWGWQITYYEMTQGLLTNVQSAAGLVVFLYVLWLALRARRRGRRQEARPLLAALMLFFVSAISDTAISGRLYEFAYTMEYAYLGIVLLMASSMSRQVVESAGMKEALAQDIVKRQQAEEALRQYTRRLETLREIDQAILVAQSPEAIAEATLRHIRQLVPCQRASVVSFDFAHEEAQIIAAHLNGVTELGVGRRIPLGEYGLDDDLRAGRPHLVADILALVERTATQTQLLAEGIHSSLNIPLLSQGRLIGALNLGAQTANTFTTEHLVIAREAADQVALVLQQTGLRQELERHAIKLEQHAAQMEALQQVGLELTAQLDVETLLHSIATWAMELLGGTGGGLYLYRPDQDVLEWCIGVGTSPPPIGSSLHKGEGLAGRVWAQRRPLLVNDYEKWEGHAVIYGGLPNFAAVSAPVLWGEEFLGVLSVIGDPPGAFTQPDGELLTLFATQAAVAIRNARLYEAARGRAERLAVVNHIAAAVGATLRLDDLLETVYRETTSIFSADSFFIALYDKGEDELEFRFQVDEGVRLPAERQSAQAGLTSLVIARRKPLLIYDLEQEQAGLPTPQLWGSGKLPASWLGVPMCIGERLVGVICVQSYQPRAYTEDDQLLLATIADQVGVALDQAQLYQTLHDSEEKYRTLFEQANDAVFVVTLQGRILEVNERACHLLGYEREELLQRRMSDVAIPPTVDRPPDIEDGLSGGLRLETEYIRRDGSRVPVEVGQALLEVGGQSLMLALVHDITRRKQTERAWRFTQFAVDRISDAAYWTEADGRLGYVNDAACRSLGYSREELLGMTLHDIDPNFPPEAWPEHWRQVRERGSFTYESFHRTRSGRLLPVEITVNFLEFEGKEFNCAFAHDITRRRQLEEQLRQAQKMEAIGTLAGGVAHDFNNILTSILGYASLVQQELPIASPLFTDMETIITSARRAGGLTEQLLTFARRSAQTEQSPLDPNAVVGEVVKLLERTIDKAISIEPHLAGDLKRVKGDTSQLHQALLNLCLNARDAMPAGGKLIIETQNVRLGEATTFHDLHVEPGDYVVLSVTDTGVGMEPSVQQRIFEPFFTTKEHGRGLGLAMVYGIVRGHGGVVHVYSVPGQGTTFKIYLPALRDTAAAPATLQKTVPGGQETVLIVDDEEDVRRVLQRILERGGYTVIVAQSGTQAAELYRQRSSAIELVVLDVIMPRMGGQETFRRLRELNPGIRVLLSSGYSESGQTAEILEEGARGFLQKPYDVETVLRKVRQTLDTDA
jgi:PAS domain S-box-containing protein